MPEPPLGSDQRARLEAGVALFNRRLFYECHDTLEELWAGLRGQPRELVQGLIQVAVGFYHLGNGNRVGAARLLERALARLAVAPASWSGLDLQALRGEVARWREALAGGGPLPAGGPPAIAAPAARPAAG